MTDVRTKAGFSPHIRQTVTRHKHTIEPMQLPERGQKQEAIHKPSHEEGNKMEVENKKSPFQCGMGENARNIWIHYAKGSSQEAYVMAKQLLRNHEISIMDRAYLHLLLANDPCEKGVPHAQVVDRILTAGRAELEKQKKTVHFDTLLCLSRQLYGDASSAKNYVNKSE